MEGGGCWSESKQYNLFFYFTGAVGEEWGEVWRLWWRLQCCIQTPWSGWPVCYRVYNGDVQSRTGYRRPSGAYSRTQRQILFPSVQTVGRVGWSHPRMSEPKSVKGNIFTTQNHTNKSGYVKTFRAKVWPESEPWLRTIWKVIGTKRHYKCGTPLFLYISKLVNDS